MTMADRFMQTVLTPSVLAAQEHYYGRRASVGSAPERDPLTDEERDLHRSARLVLHGHHHGERLALRSTSRRAAGIPARRQPDQLAFADYKGNRQMLSTGNLAVNDRVALFLMDYPRRERLKILGHARVEDARQHPELVAQLAEPEVHRLVERLFFIEVVSFDWNCPKYITPRYTAAEVEEAVAPLKQRIAELEARSPNEILN